MPAATILRGWMQRRLRNQDLRAAARRRPAPVAQGPVLPLHAKTMVVDRRLLAVGTSTLDPPSANLDTECVTRIPSPAAARGVLAHLEREIGRGNAWRVLPDVDPDAEAGACKRLQLLLRRAIPKSIR